jgi:hypothetical protein
MAASEICVSPDRMMANSSPLMRATVTLASTQPSGRLATVLSSASPN